MVLVTLFSQARKSKIRKTFSLTNASRGTSDSEVSLKVKNYLHYLKAKPLSPTLHMLEVKFKLKSFHDNRDGHNSFSSGSINDYDIKRAET